jgi:hypothetical protein
MLQPMFHEAADISLKHFGSLFFLSWELFLVSVAGLEQLIHEFDAATRPLSLYSIQALLTLNSMTTNAINPRRQVIKFPVVQLELFP